ncbi:AbiEi antitoxin N-terminal domain-containing protein [Proteus mirabilis]|uniref:AbiEi antitoxin N-terminal domain-containing protein n=2 Tax=Proteus mirabilis TaxID=584 RepID=UPI0023F9B9A7|nr:AbiEi antitoxin N-terminal domain-containing protein [Proteus mirabilis]MDF7329217.1 AbiEi antitoxin N-terminal domain-containing protein [Proteus mirabilis]HEJ9541895.1 AbiEi antitoxin N-terminal domain-containing protein [Proteus mirabilis]HEJ9543010.1 AbiEi antitoxin N-terminal domain-containing protein [Proteus mirabilis]
MVSHSQCETVKESYKQSLKTLLPYGMLATKKWLTEQGLSTHALDNAVKTDTLLLLATGVYSQYSRAVTWEGVVASMQRMMEKSVDEQLPPVVVGGLSALSISGLSQYLSLGSTPHIHLYATKKLPSWLTRLSLGHSISKLWPDSLSNIRQQRSTATAPSLV